MERFRSQKERVVIYPVLVGHLDGIEKLFEFQKKESGVACKKEKKNSI